MSHDEAGLHLDLDLDVSDNVIYRRGEDYGADAWDDTILIKAYDNAVSAMKANFCEQHSGVIVSQSASHRKKKSQENHKGPESHNSSFQREWNVGDSCKAVYTEDGHIYSAQIFALNNNKRTCIVRYTDYGNEEEQALDDLLPASIDMSSVETKSDSAVMMDYVRKNVKSKRAPHRAKHVTNGERHRSRLNAAGSQQTGSPCGTHQLYTLPHVPPPPSIPPPPPFLNNRNCEHENEALYTMLISWYMSGYHTGYYQGMKNSDASPAWPSHTPHN